MAQPGLKIGVKQDGWYRVTQPEMIAAAFDVTGDAAKLRLYVDGNEVPIWKADYAFRGVMVPEGSRDMG